MVLDYGGVDRSVAKVVSDNTRYAPQRALLDHQIVEPPVGFEPTTPALQERIGPVKQRAVRPISAELRGFRLRWALLAISRRSSVVGKRWARVQISKLDMLGSWVSGVPCGGCWLCQLLIPQLLPPIGHLWQPLIVRRLLLRSLRSRNQLGDRIGMLAWKSPSVMVSVSSISTASKWQNLIARTASSNDARVRSRLRRLIWKLSQL
jgi:hypothetical protein